MLKKFNSLLALFLIVAFSLSAKTTISAQAQDDYSSKIIDGSLRPVSEYPMVAQLYIADSTCTGTLVGSRYLLTAAHCFFDENSRLITKTNEMSALLNGNTYNVSKVTIHPSYVSRNNACISNETDAAVIELKSDVSGITPVPLSRNAPVVGTRVLLVGFGIQGGGSRGEDGTFPEDGFVNIGYTTIERVTDNLYVDWDFNPGESNTASGDSGGPAFTDIDGVRYLHSITCGGTGHSEYGTESTNTRADAIASWVDSIISGSNGGGGGAVNSLKLSKVKIDFGDNNNYTLLIQGSLDVGKNFNPKNSPIKITVAEYSDSFKLSRSGTAERRGGGDYVELTGKLAKGVYKNSNIKFEIGLVDKESLYDILSSHFPEDTSSLPASFRVDLPITIKIHGNTYTGSVSLKSQKNGERWLK